MPPKKRKGSGKQADTKSKQPKQDGQKAVSHDIEVPLDEGFTEHGTNDPHVARSTFPLFPLTLCISYYFHIRCNASTVLVYLVVKACQDHEYFR